MAINQNRTYLKYKVVQKILKWFGFTVYHLPNTAVYVTTKDSNWKNKRVDIVLQDCKGLTNVELDEVVDRICQIYNHQGVEGD